MCKKLPDTAASSAERAEKFQNKFIGSLYNYYILFLKNFQPNYVIYIPQNCKYKTYKIQLKNYREDIRYLQGGFAVNSVE